MHLAQKSTGCTRCIHNNMCVKWAGFNTCLSTHYNDVIMGTIASQITSLTIVYSTVYSDTDQRKHQSSASLAFVRGSPRVPVNSPHKWPVTRKMFPFDDVIMIQYVSMPLSLGASSDCICGLWRNSLTRRIVSFFVFIWYDDDDDFNKISFFKWICLQYII